MESSNVRDIHAGKRAADRSAAGGERPTDPHHRSDVQVREVPENRLNGEQRLGRDEFRRLVARVIHDNGGETRAAKRLGRKPSFIRARIDGRIDWAGGDAIAAMGPDELDDLGKALRVRADTLRGVYACSLPVLVRAKRLHKESSEAHQAVLALAAAGAEVTPEQRIAAMRDAIRELSESARENEAAMRDLEVEIQKLAAG